ncbi:MAG TPA: class I SAM-dependent methyltransferase [Aggregatilineales bacterium]|nr:class I SAM-dependent methyltransferase [Aggregatilineales bacterium]
MNDATVKRLNAINREFYCLTAVSFDETRQRAWPGWDRLLPLLPPSLAVLDVGCGNGRFGVFLASRFALRYHGIDSSPDLLALARNALPDAGFEERDIVESPPDSGQYDLVALFGVLHHIPGADRRLRLLRILAERVTPGGMLAVASWRFYEFERFRRRILPWPPDLADEVEDHDYLLDWRRDAAAEPAIRYCHYVDDAEQSRLVAASGLEPILSYRADGSTGDLNSYVILRAPSAPLREGEG